MRASTRILWVSLTLAAIGLALVLFHHADGFTGYSIGSADDSNGYSSGVGIAFDGAHVVTTQAMIGFGLIWLSSLLVVGVLARRQSDSAELGR